jgi:hypothetical protein
MEAFEREMVGMNGDREMAVRGPISIHPAAN